MSSGSAEKAIRIIARDPFNAHTAFRYREYNIMNFENINRYQLGNFMYKFVNNLLPDSFSNYFTRVVEMHGHCTRSSSGGLYVIIICTH